MLIFLVGPQRSGKDTVANYLVEKYGFTKLALADRVKELARELFGMDGKDRGLLIQLGTKMREIDPNVWINVLWKRYLNLREVSYPIEPNVVISDVRFQNEWKFFESRGGIGVSILAPREVREKREGYDPEFETDTTETELYSYVPHWYLPNVGPLEDLYQQVDSLMKREMKTCSGS